MNRLEDLEVYKKSKFLRKELSDLVKDFPKDEKYRLVDQLIRASRSITANIAEGYGRFHYKENIQYLRQSRGSMYECIDHISVALEEKYINSTTHERFYNQIETCLKILNGYINYLKTNVEKTN